jgi:DNA-binding transcriptional LysR family regulator
VVTFNRERGASMFRVRRRRAFSAAALLFSNPVSRIIAELETSLGIRFLSRTTRTVVLTQREVRRSSYF